MRDASLALRVNFWLAAAIVVAMFCAWVAMRADK